MRRLLSSVTLSLACLISKSAACSVRDADIEIGAARVQWRLCSKRKLASRYLDGTNVSLPGFEDSDTFVSDCFPATSVPGTALTNMVNNDMFDGVKDLFLNKDLEKVPDIHEVGRDFYTFYWRTSLNMSSLGINDTLGCDMKLNIRSINYRASVFCNGRALFPEIPIESEPNAAGMFHRWTYLISRSISQHDEIVTLAILVEPPDYPGKVTGRQGGDHDISKNAAIQQYSAGWDWIRGTPDRNTGLWDRIGLGFTDSKLSIQNVHVRTLTNITTPPPQQILVGISVDLLHHQSISSLWPEDRNIITLVATVTETQESSSIEFSTTDLACEKQSGVQCETNFQLPPIAMKNASVWWPHNYGDPILYRLRLTLSSSSHGTVHSEMTTRFGLRTFTTFVDPRTNGRIFLCNGVKVFLQGGNWIGTDQFQRFSTSSSRYKNEVFLHKQMGLNLIRVWGGGITERPEFFEATDEAGMLVLQEFWMTGDNNGRWGGSYSSPENHHIYFACAKDMVLMLRNHASLLLWVGGNELYPATKSPPRDIADGLVALLSELDPDRFYIPSSTSNYTDYDPSFALSAMDGPYGFLSPFRFYQRNPGLRFWNKTLARHLRLGFQPEVGASSTPTYRGVRKFLTGSHLEHFPSTNDAHVPPAFEFHNYLSYTDDVGHDHIYAYGPPTNMSEYCFRAQLAQYTQVKGLFEGYQRYMWKYYTAMIFWKTQSPWPSFRGFMYDSWLETTGGYWGVQAALEGGQPLHIQLGNWKTDTSIVIINRSPNVYDGTNFTVSCQWWDIAGYLLVSKQYSIAGSELRPHSVYDVRTRGLRYPNSTSLGVAYLRLTLNSNSNSTRVCRRFPCSFNDYYMSNPSSHQILTSLGEWRNDSSRLLHLLVECIEDIGDTHIAIGITNLNKEVALQVRVRVDQEIEGYFYSAQYFSLLPSETRVVSVTQMFIDEDVAGRRPLDASRLEVLVDGLNVSPQRLECVGAVNTQYTAVE